MALHEPFVLIVLTGALGLVVGSFLNVVIARLPKILDAQWRCDCAELLQITTPTATVTTAATTLNQPLSLSSPPSSCPHCGARIKPWYNLPIFGYLWLRGRCADCRAPISLRYPLIELLSAVLCAYAAWHFGFGWPLLGALVMLWILLALAFIDADTQFLPDDLTLPLLWSGLLFNYWGVFVPLSTAVVGAMAGYVSLWLVYWLFKMATGKEGMGYGDFKLLAALGAWLGWTMLPQIVLLASVVGAVAGITFIVCGRQQRGSPLPFGPYLVLAGVIALFYGADINHEYLGLF